MTVTQEQPAPSFSPDEILVRFEQAKANTPGIRPRDAARSIGISEAQLVAARVGDGVTKLAPEWALLLNGLGAVGRVMSLVRNESAVHERKGIFENVRVPNNQGGIILGEDIDLRLFLGQWTSMFLVEDQTKQGLRRSIQIFDQAGDAVQKIYPQDTADHEAFDALIKDLRAEVQDRVLDVIPAPAFELSAPLQQEDLGDFQEAWAGMTDVHQLFRILRKYDLSRKRALEAVGTDWARPVEPHALRHCLEAAAERQSDIMIFVGNRGIIQIHTGTVTHLKEMGPWFNVLDPDFNLHLREDQIGECWLVRKPTKDGIVSSLEVFDQQGDIILQMFGKRQEGQKESPEWRTILDGLADWAREAA
ncbi:hemin-degrading factor [Aestuariispira insulae]|uniref:Putative hemin transport protein n=1 Tax=Aestuariispira insulae TaxID=1461337 RepID=A0A3D9H5E2_9PROT|nr:ChuX/HutX family heme-like substrate-binding protein [Aestuariispira insulae]RED44166.1 putative hemin transport protein [Aestuariispira insulae]